MTPSPVQKLWNNKGQELSQIFGKILGVQNIIKKYKKLKSKSKHQTSNYVKEYYSIFKQLEEIRQFESLFNIKNQVKIKIMLEQIEKLLKFNEGSARLFKSSHYQGNIQAFKNRVKIKYPVEGTDTLITYNHHKYNKANFTNIYMNPDNFVDNNGMFPRPGNILNMDKRYYFNHHYKLQRLFNQHDRIQYKFKVPYEYSRHTKSIEEKIQNQLETIYWEILANSHRSMNMNRISVKENDNLVIRLFGTPLSPEYKYFIEKNKNSDPKIKYKVYYRESKIREPIVITPLLFTVRKTNNSDVKFSIPIRLVKNIIKGRIKNRNKFYFTLIEDKLENSRYKKKLINFNKFKVSQ